MSTFLSPEWFNKVNELTDAAGDLSLSPALANLAINLNVKDSPQGDLHMSFENGKLQSAPSAKATTTLTLDANTLRKIFLEFDIGAAMQAFMTGKIQIAGDMTKLMALQSAQPSQAQKDLFGKILSMTT